MFRRFSANFAIVSILIDGSLALLSLFLAEKLLAYVAGASAVPISQDIGWPSLLFLIVPPFWVVIFALASVYDPKRIPLIVDEFQSVTIASFFALLAFAGLLYLLSPAVPHWLFLTFVLVSPTLLLGWRTIFRLVFRLANLPPAGRRVLIVGAGEVGRRVGNMIRQYAWTGVHLVGYLDDDPAKQNGDGAILGKVEQIHDIVESEQIQDVVIALPRRAYGLINQLILVLHDLPVNVRVIPDYFSLALYRAQVEDFGGLPMISLRDPALSDVQRFSKRVFDLVVGGLLLLTALPPMVIIALIIKLTSPGPVLFRQERVGENGKLFTMYKFRSMIPGAEKMQETVNEVDDNGNVIHKKEDDPRVTRIGRFLRRTSLDELPQLLNVIKGDMSLVGPRPELPWLVERYEPWQRKRFAVPQGITGWWQVNGRSGKPMHLHTEEDLYYVQNYSLRMDIYILIKTPFTVLRGKGAY